MLANSAYILRYDPETGRRSPFDFEPFSARADRVAATMDKDALRVGYDAFFEALPDVRGYDERTGLEYSVMSGGQPGEVSQTDGMLLCGALAIPLQEMEPIAEFLRREADDMGIVGRDGKPLGTVLVNGPDRRFDARLTKAERQAIRVGNMQEMGVRTMDLAQRLLPTPPDGQPIDLLTIGYSMGTITASEAAVVAPQFGAQFTSLTLGAIPGVRDLRWKPDLLSSFASESLHGSYPADVPKVFTHPSKSIRSYLGDVVKSRGFYLSVMSGVASRSGVRTIAAARRVNPELDINIAGGTGDKINRFRDTLDMLNALRGRIGTERLLAAFAVGYGHAWARRPNVLGGLVGMAFEAPAARMRMPRGGAGLAIKHAQ